MTLQEFVLGRRLENREYRARKLGAIEGVPATLAAICAILGALLAGISFLCIAFHIGAIDQARAGYRSVLAQLAGAAVGQGPLYYIAMASVLCILALSASTSFVAFPRLCRTVAEDGFLPKSFAIAGRRLVSSVGILYLAATAAMLLVAFDGITNRLIPLFAIGAFLTFTLSQAGMVAHWHRELRARRGDSTCCTPAGRAGSALGSCDTAGRDSP